jgi:hypothetical protein
MKSKFLNTFPDKYLDIAYMKSFLNFKQRNKVKFKFNNNLGNVNLQYTFLEVSEKIT